LIFNTTTVGGANAVNLGLYWFDGIKWEAFLDNTPPNAAWSLTGNAVL